MDVRTALPQENQALQQLQARAPMGQSLVVSTVNSPDFFARAATYESGAVFNAYDQDQIVGSAACAVRDAVVGERVCRVGYEFQYFTSPDHRRRGVAHSLRQSIENHLVARGAALSYALIMEGNVPSMRLFEGEGFSLHRQLVMPGILVGRQVDVPGAANVRAMRPDDLEAVAELLTHTWRGHELFEPTSADSLARQIERVATLDYGDVLVCQERGQIVACVAPWDWSQITKITVVRLSWRMQILRQLLVLTRIFPRFPRSGDTLRQMMLTTIGFRSPADLAPLVRQVNNLAWREGIEQLYCICERGDRILESMKGFMRADTGIHLYVKRLQPDVSLTAAPVALTGFDM